MNFETAAQFGAILSKDYAEDFFKLLVNYQDISASEAASRLSLHIRTAQDFLENLTDLKIVKKTEVFEKKTSILSVHPDTVRSKIRSGPFCL